MRGHQSGQRQQFIGSEFYAEQGESPDGIEIPQRPVLVQLPKGEAVLVPKRAWQRVKWRVQTMPKASALWLLLAGAFLGVAVEKHDESALPYVGLAVLFFLVHSAVNKSNQRVREDIVSEMELHEPSGKRRRE